VQEAALTGESAPVPKDSGVLGGDVAIGDRSNMLFQNTSVTRGTGAIVVTATGMRTEMGQIATMLTSVTRTRSPLQQELDSLTKVIGVIAWTAVAFIVVIGWARGMPVNELLLLGTAMAISAIPTGMPAFVSGLLSIGAKQLAEAKAVVKNLTDVETLWATSAINTDKTGTLTMNQMMVSTITPTAPGSMSRGRATESPALSRRLPARHPTSHGWRSVCASTATRRWQRRRRRRRSDGAARRPGGQARLMLRRPGERTRLAEVPFDSTTSSWRRSIGASTGSTA
jgi:magnesium-transporting ATPase (P-type)